MKILLVGDYPRDPRLGSAKVPLKLAEEFQNLGHECRLLFQEDLGVRPSGLLRQAVSPILAARAIARELRNDGPIDVIDAASAEGIWFGAFRGTSRNRQVALVCRSNGLEHLNYRRMLGDHDAGLLHKPWSRRLYHPLVRLSQVAGAARMADRMILLNDIDRDFVLARGWKRPDEAIVVDHGVSDVFLNSSPPFDAERGRGILFCGTWTGMKGVDYLAPAFAQLIERGIPARLSILGGAVPEATIRAAFPESAQSRIEILPRADEAEVMRHYRTHDLLVFPSTYEGFGMVLLEAMTQRLPVVSTPQGAALRLVKDNVTGLVVPPRDPTAIADAVARMLADSSLRSRLAEGAFERVRHMSWRRTAEQTLDVYREAISARRR